MEPAQLDYNAIGGFRRNRKGQRLRSCWNKPAGTFKFKRPVPLPSGGTARIVYGGSVTPQNAEEILQLDNVGGALVGGAAQRTTGMALSRVSVKKEMAQAMLLDIAKPLRDSVMQRLRAVVFCTVLDDPDMKPDMKKYLI